MGLKIIKKRSCLFHIIFFSFFPKVKDKNKNEIIKMCDSLGKKCGGKEAGILFWVARRNIDLRKKIDFIEIGIFKDKKSFKKFKDHPYHKEFVEIIKKHADWFVVDFFDYFPKLS